MSNPALLSPAQFEALAAYVEAAVELAVAKAEYRCGSDGCDYLIESIRMSKACDAVEKALVDPEGGE